MTGDRPRGDRRPEDPLEPWREFQKAWLDAWSKTMSETVASEEFARTLGASLETFLQTWAPMKQMERVVERYLEGANLPTRREVAGLSERLTHLEMGVQDLDAKLDEILSALRGRQRTSTKAASARRPARKTRSR